MDTKELLIIENISKAFPGVKALTDVSFSIQKGEVRALCGENGAGKSTLIKILTGIYHKDAGKIIFNGKECTFKSASDARNAGISTVYQELNLIPYLTVAENIFLGDFPRNRWGIDWKTTREKAKKLLDDLNLKIDPDAVLHTLGAASQQMVAIARALRDNNCDLMILDEPTSSLDVDETEMLFSFLRDLRSRGVAMIFITHRLEEIYRICDTITVLKDGKLVCTSSVSQMDQYKLVAAMVGHEVDTEERIERAAQNIKKYTGEPALELRHIRSESGVRDVSLQVWPGEIVGLAGLLGSGRTETARTIYGCDKLVEGEILVDGTIAHLSSPAAALKRRIAFCTENRRYDGIIPNMEVKNNAVLNSLPFISRFGLINNAKRNRIVKEYVDKLQVKTPSINQPIRLLSGGNQQKVILIRALATNPRIIILDEPTRGIDVGAKAEIEVLMRQAASSGIGILFISSELPELIRNSDRVVVMRDGCSVGELVGDEISTDNINRLIAGERE